MHDSIIFLLKEIFPILNMVLTKDTIWCNYVTGEDIGKRLIYLDAGFKR